MPSPDAKAEAQKPPPGPPASPGPVRPDADVKGEAAEGSRNDAAASRWVQRGFHGAILGTLGVACAYLLTPGLYSPRIEYGDESLHQFSNQVVKARRDYNIPDEETTRRKRDEGREAVLPVYDYDLTIAESAVERVRSAFQRMQEVAREVAEAQKEPASEVKVEDPKRRADKKKPEPPDAERLRREAVFFSAFEGHREALQRRLETQLDDDIFKSLADHHFSEEVQREAEKLVARANGQMVAEYRDQLALTAGRGVVVRRRSGSELMGEKVIADVSNIRDQEEVRQNSDRWAGDLPQEMEPALARALRSLVARQLRANLRFNKEETDERRRNAAESVKPVVIQLRKGERIIGDGERIERWHLVVFKAMKAQSSSEDQLLVRLGGGLFAVVLILVVHGFARVSLRRFRPTRKDALLGALTLLGMLAAVNFSITVADALRERSPSLPSEALYYAVPFAAGAMLIRVVVSAEASAVFAIVFAALSGVLVGNSLAFGLYALLGSLVASAKSERAKDRATLFNAGVTSGVASAAAVLCLELLGKRLSGLEIAESCLAAFAGNAVLVPMVVMGVTPIVEVLFGYTTDIKLLELANLNHPALKELIVQAPGTYHHSIILGSLVEAAAEAIHANPLLARVCAYYHDIGKGKNPLYFGENQRGENRHDKLAPQMSAVIIKRHVTDGLEMAKQYKLPRQVADAIPQHHGTKLVGYFYHKAMKEQEGRESPQPVEDSLYRYAGPKPQFPEAALVMMADAVEAAARAMPDPTPQKLQALVQKIINGVFADGQLDECDLTLRDLNEIARAFYRTLGGIYHSRPEYPPGAMQGPRPPPLLAEVKEG